MPVATEVEQYQAELKALTELLKGGAKPLASLPKNLQDPDFLASALEGNKIQVGRPDHSWERVQAAEEHSASRPIVLKVSKTVGWTSLSKGWEKTIFELLLEEEGIDPKIRLQVKLSKRTEK